MRRLRILVTAVGGDLGQAIVKALRISSYQVEVEGCDMNASSVGAAFVDHFHEVPRADSPEYMDSMARICGAEAIDCIIPASEAEILRLSASVQSADQLRNVEVICQPHSWIETFGDKLACMKALEVLVPLAPFADGDDDRAVERLVTECGFPLVVKPRRLSGSRRVSVVHSAEELQQTRRSTPRSIVQGFLEDASREFSVGVFVCDAFTAAIAYRRALGPVGCSWSAVTCDDPLVLQYARKICVESGLRGSANVQVRYGSEGVRLLEINPRFSSLVAARAACGFRDVDWSLALALGEQPHRPAGFRHLRFRRFIDEMLDFGDGLATLEEWAPRRTRLP
jgi:carbamoyl-phosphate synthase large subunit